MPISLFHQVVTDLVTIFPRGSQWRRNADYLYGVLRDRFKQAQRPGATPAIAVHCGEDQREFWEMLGRHLLYFLTFVPQIPVIAALDAMGKSSWKTMRRRVGTMFRRPSEFSPPSVHRSGAEALDSPATGATAVFLGRLEKLLNDANQENRRLTIIGHSMGTIIANEIFTRYPGLPCDKIVYMAAACSIRDFERSVLPILACQPQARFFNLCLHPVAEAREIQWAFLDFPPRGTLLEWIDNFLEDPERIVDRVLGKWDNVIQATHIIDKSLRARVHLKAFGVGGPQDLRRHDEFVRKEFWSPEFWNVPITVDPSVSRGERPGH
jgi:pimeloyl-ACP methyl ester carboxylesterase